MQGDVVCVFDGAKLPYVLRPTVDGGAYTIIRHYFIHGIMFGETMCGNVSSTEDIILR
jgi:hypothetical protein